jgi:ATP-dependent DNA ligase
MRQGRPDTSRMRYFAFDLVRERDVDLRPLPLSERQFDLARLCNKGRKAVPCLRLVENFPEGPPLRALSARRHRFEEIVLKVLEQHMPRLTKDQVRALAGGEPVSAQAVRGAQEADRADRT